MCGIAGIVSGPGLRADRDTLSAMLARIRHRGPDADGVWSEDGVWLGHRRLSILDLSPTGAQPMLSHCGRYVISFNGEIYNFQELRAQLEQGAEIDWRGSSDTEALVELIASRGLKAALEQINGMFAFALWDRREKTLSLVRDRFGEKPLYYGLHGGGLVFASELTAIEAHDGFPKEIDDAALTQFLKSGNVPSPLAIYKGVRKLPPGCFVTFSAQGCGEVEAYWSLAEVARRGLADPIHDEVEIVDRLEAALERSCRQKMISDVPLGAFLSGGIDSSTIVALMQKHSSRPIKTFTIGFNIPKYNEAEHAKAVANHLGTEHTEQILTEADALAVVPQLGALYDEPFADSSAIPTYLVSRMARSHVTVCLSGDGGDELFAGYLRHLQYPKIWRGIAKIPMRASIARLIAATPAPLLSALLSPLDRYGSRYSRSDDPLAVKALRFAERLGARDFAEFYESMNSFILDAKRFLARPSNDQSVENDRRRENGDRSFVDWMRLDDGTNYMPNDILVKVDRAAMAVSLEGRMPLLDPEVAEVAWRTPVAITMKDGAGKWPLRRVLARHVPPELFDRPKMGFGIPVREWLGGSLRQWAGDLLSPERLRRQGLLNEATVSSCLDDFMTGRRQEPRKLWALLALQSWLEQRGR